MVRKLKDDEVYLEHSEVVIRRTHNREKCLEDGFSCSIHNRSDHSMRTFPQHWRSDRALMERICPCGVGHPDPDHMSWYLRAYGASAAYYEGIHGCCGCCGEYDPTDSND